MEIAKLILYGASTGIIVTRKFTNCVKKNVESFVLDVKRDGNMMKNVTCVISMGPVVMIFSDLLWPLVTFAMPIFAIFRSNF